MLKRHNPDSVAPPFGTYSHGIEVPPDARWLYVSGQVGFWCSPSEVTRTFLILNRPCHPSPSQRSRWPSRRLT